MVNGIKVEEAFAATGFMCEYGFQNVFKCEDSDRLPEFIDNGCHLTLFA